MAIELMCLLAASTVNLEQAGMHGTATELTRTEIAALLAGLSRPAVLFAYAKYLQDESSIIDFKYYMIQFVAGMAYDEQWRLVKGKPLMKNLAVLTVHELVTDNICKKCRGVGFKRQKICACCSGLGRSGTSKRRKAQFMDIDISNWCRTWQQRFESLMNYGNNLDYQVRLKLNFKKSH